MEKIISLFKRNYETDQLVRNEVVPGAEWVLAGEGVATRKWDGTACMVENGNLYKRYEIKRGRTTPPDFRPAGPPDSVTGEQVGWTPVGNGPEDRWHREAFAEKLRWPNGTYELCGPKIQGNPERFITHVLVQHGTPILPYVPRTFSLIKTWLAAEHDVEGIVWWHPDGRKVKIKAKDFGLRRQKV